MADPPVIPIASAFPAPPLFYRHFTDSNLAQHEALKQASHPTSLDSMSLLSLPPELRYLVPPNPPVDGVYRSFGEIRSLNSPTQTPLPATKPLVLPSPPTPAHLRSITRSLLLNFLEFLAILVADPSQAAYGPKWEDMQDLFRAAYEVLDMYRPYQAKESLIRLMDGMVEQGKAELEGVKALREKVENVLHGLGEGMEEDLAEDNWRKHSEPSGILDNKKEEERRVWEALMAVQET